MYDYWELRDQVAKLHPRMTQLIQHRRHVSAVREKGRKRNYSQFNVSAGEMVPQERLLNTSEINSFVEVSCRAGACPMPLNMDIWDGLLCPFGCKYCFANAFWASLYTAFFDNAKTMGLRHCNTDSHCRELDKLMTVRGTDPQSHSSEIKRAFAMQIPVRFGIRFEDFLYEERAAGVSLKLLNYLADQSYPLMINTKSDLVGEPAYASALGRNKGGAAVHITMITCREDLIQSLEPGAPSFAARLQAARNLIQAGVEVVARIEPFLVFINDKKEDVGEYIQRVRDVGVKHITFDTYSYTATNPGIRQAFINEGIDYDRLYDLGADSQGLGSLLLSSFMDVFKNQGFSVSSFDMGCAPINNDSICCEVGPYFRSRGAGFNFGCTVIASRYIISRRHVPTRWCDFVAMVENHGGFLSDALKREVWMKWNCEGTGEAYSPAWSPGITPVGHDADGVVWSYVPCDDFRVDLLEGALGYSLTIPPF